MSPLPDLHKGLRRLLIPVLAMLIAVPVIAFGKELSNKQIAREIEKEPNKIIINEFLRQELQEVNKYATQPLLARHPTLIFFVKQAKRSPLDSLLFLESQVHKLRDAQKRIDSLPYSLVFSSSEKKIVLGLRPVADRIVSYGLPLMKRDFYRVMKAARELADKRRKHPMELLPDPNFRDAVYRRCAADPKVLDGEVGKLSEGEQICIGLGWKLENVTITRLWLVFNDNKLPDESDYLAYRKKRSEYWQKRLSRIYAE
ncbi:hypothetical protein ACFL2Q_01810 [Thermodesulfobacteriota bacterium]